MAGTIPLALSQRIDINGAPLAGCLLYIFAAGTVATPQNAYQDFGLTIPLPNPIRADQSGLIPMFFLADGMVHVRLTDASGVVIFDYPTMQVLGPSSGSGGGGSSVDPSSIASTGDTKFRATSETLTGWVKLNAQTIGSASSGASQRANADTQNLFVYLWNNYTNAKCPVSGGRGTSGLADFQANKTMGLPDWRGIGPVGLDDMGNTAKGVLAAINFPGSSDGPTTPCGYGGEANYTLIVSEAPSLTYTVDDPGHVHGAGPGAYFLSNIPNFVYGYLNNGESGNAVYFKADTALATTGISVTDNAGGGAHNNFQSFVLGTWHIKL